MVLAVPLGVQARVLEPEVGRQVDEMADLAQQLRHDRLAGAVGQAEEHQVETVDGGGGVGRERQLGVGRPEARVQVRDRTAGLGVTGGDPDREVGVVRAQSQELGAGEPGRPHDPYVDHRQIMQYRA